MRGELLRETPLRRDGARHSGLLVLGTGRRRESNLPPLVCLVEAVKLRKEQAASSVSWARAGGGGGCAPALAAAAARA